MARPAGFKILRWTDEEKAELLRMKAEGKLLDKQIAAALGRSEASVWGMWFNIRPRDDEAEYQPMRRFG
jgi:DNA-binding NarL/FixJ family response regulator